ncbi:MAG: tyrosine-type recombinase/integrase [Thiohalocapsa sp.]
MLDQYFTRRCVLSRLRAGLFGPYLEQLADSLQQRGYSRTWIRTCLYASDKFGAWILRQGQGIGDVTPALVRKYVDELKRTRDTQCPKAGCSLNHLVKLLRQEGVGREPSEQPSTDVERWLERYDTYLEQVVGAAANTRDRYETIVRRFLVGRFGAGPVSWDTLTAEELSAFVFQDVSGRRGFGRKHPAVAIRSLLRFLVFGGEVVSGLDAAIPKVPQWQHQTLPRHLSADHVTSLLASCDSTTAMGRRDRAALLLLARLGLRAGEVVQLRLDDVDWHEGQLRIRAAKTYWERRLPLTLEVGEALVAYLREGRPASAHREIFLGVRPPFAPFSGPTCVGWLVRRACRRAGFPLELQVGAHALRHTAATQMVCQGASFKAVADVLGHQSLQTTGIYAKLDLEALAQVALPWPEVTP